MCEKVGRKPAFFAFGRRIRPPVAGLASLEHDDVSSNRHHPPDLCFRGIFAESRFATSASRSRPQACPGKGRPGIGNHHRSPAKNSERFRRF